MCLHHSFGRMIKVSPFNKAKSFCGIVHKLSILCQSTSSILNNIFKIKNWIKHRELPYAVLSIGAYQSKVILSSHLLFFMQICHCKKFQPSLFTLHQLLLFFPSSSCFPPDFPALLFKNTIHKKTVLWTSKEKNLLWQGSSLWRYTSGKKNWAHAFGKLIILFIISESSSRTCIQQLARPF